MTVVNSASALGEAVGKLIEDEIQNILKPLCSSRGYYFDRGGLRPEKRKGIQLSMINKSGNRYQLDAVIETSDGKPIIIIESKYLRYKKHNRDKASSLERGEDWAKRLKEIELLLKTDRNEYFAYSFPTTRETIQFLLDLQVDVSDLRDKL